MSTEKLNTSSPRVIPASIDLMLEVLDSQLQGCFDEGAKWMHGKVYPGNVVGGKHLQNSYYRGNVNMAEAIIWEFGPHADLKVHHNGKHYVVFGEED